jgi:hypothetical protein
VIYAAGIRKLQRELKLFMNRLRPNDVLHDFKPNCIWRCGSMLRAVYAALHGGSARGCVAMRAPTSMTNPDPHRAGLLQCGRCGFRLKRTHVANTAMHTLRRLGHAQPRKNSIIIMMLPPALVLWVCRESSAANEVRSALLLRQRTGTGPTYGYMGIGFSMDARCTTYMGTE